MQDFFKDIPKTNISLGVSSNMEDIVDIGIGENGGRLSLQISEEISKIKEGCYNCLFRGNFGRRADNQLMVSCENGYSNNRADFKCGNYKRDKAGKIKSKI